MTNREDIVFQTSLIKMKARSGNKRAGCAAELEAGVVVFFHGFIRALVCLFYCTDVIILSEESLIDICDFHPEKSLMAAA